MSAILSNNDDHEWTADEIDNIVNRIGSKLICETRRVDYEHAWTCSVCQKTFWQYADEENPSTVCPRHDPNYPQDKP